MSQEWQMPRRGEACSACHAHFEPGTAFNAYLFETPAGYERRDFCLNCPPPSEPTPIGYWRTRRPLPTVRKAAPFDREAVFSFFQRLHSAAEPHQLQFRFVLALLLWRKKVLKFVETIAAESGEAWRFIQPQSQEAFDVSKPELDEDEIERLSRQLEDLLAGGADEMESIAASNPGDTNDA